MVDNGFKEIFLSCSDGLVLNGCIGSVNDPAEMVLFVKNPSLLIVEMLMVVFWLIGVVNQYGEEYFDGFLEISDFDVNNVWVPTTNSRDAFDELGYSLYFGLGALGVSEDVGFTWFLLAKDFEEMLKMVDGCLD